MSTFDKSGSSIPAIKGKSSLVSFSTIDIKAIDNAEALRVGIVDASGTQITSFGSTSRDLKLNQVTTITASAAETTIVTAVAATYLDLYGLIVTNTSVSAVTVAIKDALAGTTRLNIAVPAGDTRGFMLPVDAAIKQSAVNTVWTATTQSVTSVIITALTVSSV